MRVAPYNYSSATPVTSPLIKERGCLYYTPWIPILLMVALGTCVGVWIAYTSNAYDSSKNGLNILGVTVSDVDRLDSAMIASAVVFFFFLVAAFTMVFLRSFVEANHDATGTTGGGSLVYLYFNAIINATWFLLTAWAIAIFIGDIAWASLLYVMRGSLEYYINANYPLAVWIPSSGEPCPGQCLNLDQFSFIDSDLSGACICSKTTMAAAYKQFDDAYDDMTAILVCAGIICIAAALLIMNLTGAFSHTKRERDYIQRLTKQSFSAF